MNNDSNTNGATEQVREEPKRTRSFNPNEHLMQLKSRDGAKDYLPVQWRLVWFREKFPHGTIETELVHLDLDRDTEEEAFVWNSEKRKSEKVIKHAKGTAIFRATIKDGLGGIATGTGSENAASFGDYIEKAETKAVGRALAALGFGTQFAGDEFNENHRIVDSPVERKATQPAPPSHNGKTPPSAQPQDGAITEQQKTSIKKLYGHLSQDVPDNLDACSYVEAVQLLQTLNAEYKTLQTQRKGA